MRGRFLGVVGWSEDGRVEIEEEFDTVDLHPVYEAMKPIPTQYVRVPSKETRRRTVSADEAKALCEFAERL